MEVVVDKKTCNAKQKKAPQAITKENPNTVSNYVIKSQPESNKGGARPMVRERGSPVPQALGSLYIYIYI